MQPDIEFKALDKLSSRHSRPFTMALFMQKNDQLKNSCKEPFSGIHLSMETLNAFKIMGIL